MTATKHKVEILAPAGSVEQLIAAVNNGCDSVYLGLDMFNARMKAQNFTLNNVREWIDYCHLYGVKVYVAINTSLKNEEFCAAVKLLYEVYKRYADGVIVTDLALMRIAATLPKPFDVVASTQLNVHDAFGAEFLKKCGADTVVCARESSIDEIKSIASTGVKTECFIHGATCVCQSGQCLFSGMVGGNSGNRGLCAQPCRKLYSPNGSSSPIYLLSARDLCGLENAKRLQEVGVSVYKIEGRNRRAEYAGISSRIYKKLFANNFSYSREDELELAEMYNRAMTKLGYLEGENFGIIYPHVQNHIGVPVGKVKGDGILAEKEIAKGDGLKVFKDSVEYCGGVAIESGIGLIRAEFDKKVRDGMEVRRTTSTKLSKDVLSARKTLPIRLEFSAHSNQLATISAKYNEICVKYVSDFLVEQALTKPTTVDEVLEQLRKSGESCYTISDIAVDIHEVFLAKSQINLMRRNVLHKLTEEIVAHYEKQFDDRLSVDIDSVDVDNFKADKRDHFDLEDRFLAVTCYTQEQLKQAKNSAKYLIFKPQVINSSVLDDISDIHCFIDLPSFSDNEYLSELLKNRKFGIVCHNVGHVELARRLNLPYIAGSGLNIYNDAMVREFADAEAFVYSLELTLNEIAKFANHSGLIFVDGKLTLMKLVLCPYKVVYNCSCKNCAANMPLAYTDELGNKFEFYRRRDTRCTFELLNGKKLSVVNKLRASGRYLIDYDELVLAHYAKINSGVIDDYVENAPYTKGRLFSKVN